MAFAAWWGILNLVLTVALLAAVVYLFVLIVRALKKYIGSKEVRAEKRAAKRSLGETLKAHRTRCHMTQEFEAESLGVSRQTVSKWENGSADPSTTNLLALAKQQPTALEQFQLYQSLLLAVLAQVFLQLALLLLLHVPSALSDDAHVGHLMHDQLGEQAAQV